MPTVCRAWHWTLLVLLPLPGLPRAYSLVAFSKYKVTGSGMLLTVCPPVPASFSTLKATSLRDCFRVLRSPRSSPPLKLSVPVRGVRWNATGN